MSRRKNPLVERTGDPKAGIYLRVSTDEQARSGLGIVAQRERCMKALEMKGWQFAGEYLDEGISGAKDEAKRPGLAKLLADVEAHIIDAVVMLDLSRLGRRTVLILDLMDRLKRLGAEFVSCKEAIDTSTAAGQAMLGFIAVMAQMERDLASERTKAALHAAGQRSVDKGGHRPYGYRRGPGDTIVIVEDEAEIVQLIYGWRLKGASMREIAFCLEDRGVPPRGARKWHHSAVQTILGSMAAYRGGQRHESPNYWPTIIDSGIRSLARAS